MNYIMSIEIYFCIYIYQGSGCCSVPHLHGVGSSVLSSHVVSIRQESSGEFCQQPEGKVWIINPTLQRKITQEKKKSFFSNTYCLRNFSVMNLNVTY